MPNTIRHPERQDVYSRVTDRIVADLERGVRPWTKPWNAEHAAGRITRPLRANGIPYRGINVVLLWTTAMERGYASPLWLTYRQAQELGGQVRKGETGTLVVFAGRITRTEQDEHGEDIERDIHFMKGYIVFNAEQADGLPAHFYASIPTTTDPVPRIEHAEAFFAATGADIRHGGNSAYYAIGSDHVQMPPFETFRDAESYCATLAHESTHWTRHPSRLDRDFGRQRWGDEGYARDGGFCPDVHRLRFGGGQQGHSIVAVQTTAI
jgi:antirestriction protein ArdC